MAEDGANLGPKGFRKHGLSNTYSEYFSDLGGVTTGEIEPESASCDEESDKEADLVAIKHIENPQKYVALEETQQSEATDNMNHGSLTVCALMAIAI
jgi:hypothetical protein